MPTSLLRVNLTCMSSTRPTLNLVSSSQHDVCSNFDTKPCQISLQVDALCLYCCSPLVDMDWAVYSSVLRLSTHAFATEHDGCVGRQMSRILKYIQRGFCFPCCTLLGDAMLHDVMNTL